VSTWIDEVKGQSVLEIAMQYTKLQRAGRSYRGACPIHRGEGSNFAVDPHKNSYTCYVCGEWGANPVDLVMKVEGLDFINAAKQAAGFYGISVPERPTRRRSAVETARLGYQATLSQPGPSGWEGLGLGSVVEPYALGTREAEGGSVELIVPLFDGGDVPKGWLRYGAGDPFVRLGLDPNSDPDAGALLFMSKGLRAAARGEVLLIAADPLHALALSAAGCPAVAAPVTHADGEPLLSRAHIERIAGMGVRQVAFLMAPLPDATARHIALKSMFANEVDLLERGMEPLIVLPPLEADAPSTRAWISGLAVAGDMVAAWLADNDTAVDLFQYRLDLVMEATSRAPVAARQRLVVEKVRPSIAAAETGDPCLFYAYSAWAARALGMDKDGFRKLYERGLAAEAAAPF
jgi:hypothetical protein